jgi:putative thioredoxin
MTNSPYIIDVTQHNFSEVVLENSFHIPVLADFWAAWCQPCQLLMPLLKKLADEFQGAFLLAKINTDQEQMLAAQLGIRGLPTVKVFRNGQIVDELIGVHPESAYRQVIDRYCTKASDSLLEQAETAWQQGQRETALRLLQEASIKDPENSDIQLALADKLLTAGHAEAASHILAELPAAARLEEPASGLLARLAFFNIVKEAPDKDTLEKALQEEQPMNATLRRQLGAHNVLEGDYEAALEQFLEILKKDPKSDDNVARKDMVAVFTILGSDNPLVTRYRRRMSALLH